MTRLAAVEETATPPQAAALCCPRGWRRLSALHSPRRLYTATATCIMFDRRHPHTKMVSAPLEVVWETQRCLSSRWSTLPEDERGACTRVPRFPLGTRLRLVAAPSIPSDNGVSVHVDNTAGNRKRLVFVCCAQEPARRPLNPDPLDLIERDFVPRAVIELGGAWAFMRGHELDILQRAAGVHIGGDAGCLERMAMGLRGTRRITCVCCAIWPLHLLGPSMTCSSAKQLSIWRPSYVPHGAGRVSLAPHWPHTG